MNSHYSLLPLLLLYAPTIHALTVKLCNETNRGLFSEIAYRDKNTPAAQTLLQDGYGGQVASGRCRDFNLETNEKHFLLYAHQEEGEPSLTRREWRGNEIACPTFSLPINSDGKPNLSEAEAIQLKGAGLCHPRYRRIEVTNKDLSITLRLGEDSLTERAIGALAVCNPYAGNRAFLQFSIAAKDPAGLTGTVSLGWHGLEPKRPNRESCITFWDLPEKSVYLYGVTYYAFNGKIRETKGTIPLCARLPGSSWPGEDFGYAFSDRRPHCAETDPLDARFFYREIPLRAGRLVRIDLAVE